MQFRTKRRRVRAHFGSRGIKRSRGMSSEVAQELSFDLQAVATALNDEVTSNESRESR